MGQRRKAAAISRPAQKRENALRGNLTKIWPDLGTFLCDAYEPCTFIKWRIWALYIYKRVFEGIIWEAFCPYDDILRRPEDDIVSNALSLHFHSAWSSSAIPCGGWHSASHRLPLISCPMVLWHDRRQAWLWGGGGGREKFTKCRPPFLHCAVLCHTLPPNFLVW